jgi:hypothetical protein
MTWRDDLDDALAHDALTGLALARGYRARRKAGQSASQAIMGARWAMIDCVLDDCHPIDIDGRTVALRVTASPDHDGDHRYLDQSEFADGPHRLTREMLDCWQVDAYVWLDPDEATTDDDVAWRTADYSASLACIDVLSADAFSEDYVRECMIERAYEVVGEMTVDLAHRGQSWVMC